MKDKVKIKSPKEFRAGQFVSVAVEITLSKPDVQKGNGIAIGVPWGFSLPQFDNPQGEGYVTFSANSKAKLNIQNYPSRERFIKLIVEDGVLEAGEKVRVCFGDRNQGSPGVRVDYQAGRKIPVPYFRLDENKISESTPTISITSQKMHNLRCHVTPTFRKANTVKMTIIAEDEYGNRDDDFSGKIRVTNSSISKDFPESIYVKPTDKGKKEIRFVPYDIKSFRICIEHNGKTSLSNPCIRTDDSFPYNLYFGEIHAHSQLSYDASGSIDELYKFGRDTAVLDFASATDHQTGVDNLSGYAGHKTAIPFFAMAKMKPHWELTCRKAKEYHRPGKFVTFCGFELAPSGLAGHRNLYFLEDYPEMITAPKNWNGKDDILNPYLQNKKVLVIPHHTAHGWSPYPINKGHGLVYSDVESKYQPIVEIYSKHGNSEYLNNPRPLYGQLPGHFIADMLNQGHKFGFIAGSDTHQGNPGSSMTHSGLFITLRYRNGLAAVWAKELTRESIWEAIFARRTYATTFNKTIIIFYVNDLFMGQEGFIRGPRHIKLKAYSNTRIIKIEIIKNNEVIFAECRHTLTPDFEIEYEDKQDSGRKEDFYYARVTESEGDTAWSSPVWVRADF